MATKVSKDRYKSSVFTGYDAEGKRKYKVFYAPTADEADYLALEFKLHKNQPESKITVAEAADRYIESRSNILSPTTLRGYRIARNHHFQGLLNMKIGDVDDNILQTAINKEALTSSAKTVKNAYGLYRSAIASFRKDFNPKVRFPDELPPEYTTPDTEGIKKILEAVKDTWVEVPVLLAVWLSLRESEILGLKWEDVSDNYIFVRRARIYDNGKMVEKVTKNKSSQRKIPLPAYIKEVLGRQERTSEYVYDTTPRSLYRRFTTVLKQNGLPHCRFHDLRHANASVMVMLGIPDKYAQVRGGWSNSATLTKRYQQTFSEEEIKTADQIDSYFNNLLHTNLHTTDAETPMI